MAILAGRSLRQMKKLYGPPILVREGKHRAISYSAGNAWYGQVLINRKWQDVSGAFSHHSSEDALKLAKEFPVPK